MAKFPEYEVGKPIKIVIPDRGDAVYTATVENAFTLFTMSPVLLVSLKTQNRTPASFGNETPALMILKLHDRRVTLEREHFLDEPEYKEEEKRAYRAYLSRVRSGELQHIDFADALKTYAIYDFTPARMEGYFNHQAHQYHEAELTAYRRLEELQGTLIPRLYTSVQALVESEYLEEGEAVPGLLIEYIPSVTLRQFFATNPPYRPEVVAHICEDAVRLIHRVSDFEALNRDVRLDNILVRQSILSLFQESPTPPFEEYKGKTCVAIDLSHVRFRREDEEYLDWMDEKGEQGEADNIGVNCERQIRESYLGPKDLVKDKFGGGVWRYKQTMRFYVPRNEEEEEEIKTFMEKNKLEPWVGPH